MTPASQDVSSEKPTTDSKKPAVKRKKIKTNLSRRTRGARRVRSVREKESLEQRRERNRKIVENRKAKLAAEDPELTEARRRHAARRHNEYMRNKKQKEKRERLLALLESITRRDEENENSREKEKTFEGDPLNEDSQMDYTIEQVNITLKCEPCQIDEESDMLQMSPVPLEVLLEEK